MNSTYLPEQASVSGAHGGKLSTSIGKVANQEIVDAWNDDSSGARGKKKGSNTPEVRLRIIERNTKFSRHII